MSVRGLATRNWVWGWACDPSGSALFTLGLHVYEDSRSPLGHKETRGVLARFAFLSVAPNIVIFFFPDFQWKGEGLLG